MCYRSGVLPIALMLLSCTGSIHTYPWSSGNPSEARLAASIAAGADPMSAPFTGVWDGESVDDCSAFSPYPERCHAEQKIEFQMLQNGARISGYYRCAYGTQVCLNLNEAGTIRDASISGSTVRMRVMNPDGSMCFFTGRRRGETVDGNYSCLQGGGVYESGVFKVKRVY